MPVSCIDSTQLAGTTFELWLADTFADLADIDVSVPASSLTSLRQALVAGNATPGDGGGGIFFYDENSAATVNAASVSASNFGNGRWVASNGVRWLTAPANSAAPGQPGDTYLSGFYAFRCIAVNTWRRNAHSTF